VAADRVRGSYRSRDERARFAVAAGVTKHRVHVLSGLGRMTIERILDSASTGTDSAQAASSNA
jgi:hypothetical protein